MAIPRLCSIPECGKPYYAVGFCRRHRHRWLRHGDPLAGRTPTGEPLRYLRDVVLLHDGEECLIWAFHKTPDGYGFVRLNGRKQIVSRVVCTEVNGPPPTNTHQAAHSCGRGRFGCVAPNHLSWKTPLGNSADMITHGTQVRGEQSPQATVTIDQVREIRALKGKMRRRDIAARIGVGLSCVKKIHDRTSWAWLE